MLHFIIIEKIIRNRTKHSRPVRKRIKKMQNSIAESNLEWIVSRNYAGTE